MKQEKIQNLQNGQQTDAPMTTLPIYGGEAEGQTVIPTAQEAAQDTVPPAPEVFSSPSQQPSYSLPPQAGQKQTPSQWLQEMVSPQARQEMEAAAQQFKHGAGQALGQLRQRFQELSKKYRAPTAPGQEGEQSCSAAPDGSMASLKEPAQFQQPPYSLPSQTAQKQTPSQWLQEVVSPQTRQEMEAAAQQFKQGAGQALGQLRQRFQGLSKKYLASTAPAQEAAPSQEPAQFQPPQQAPMPQQWSQGYDFAAQEAMPPVAPPNTPQEFPTAYEAAQTTMQLQPLPSPVVPGEGALVPMDAPLPPQPVPPQNMPYGEDVSWAAPRVGFLTAIKNCVKKTFNFSGRASRTEFWFFQPVFWVVFWGALFIPIVNMVVIAAIVMELAVGARRMHDRGKSGWWQFLPLGALVAAALPWTMMAHSLIDGILFNPSTGNFVYGGIVALMGADIETVAREIMGIPSYGAIIFSGIVSAVALLVFVFSVLNLFCRKGQKQRNRFDGGVPKQIQEMQAQQPVYGQWPQQQPYPPQGMAPQYGYAPQPQWQQPYPPQQ